MKNAIKSKVIEFISIKIKTKSISLGSHNIASKSMYIEQNGKIERISELIYFFMVELTVPSVLFPALFITTINYLIHDFGNESFFLPLRMS